MNKPAFQTPAIRDDDSATEQDHSLTVPAPPPSGTYETLPPGVVVVRPGSAHRSGLRRAVQDRDPHSDIGEDELSEARDTVPSPPPTDDDPKESRVGSDPSVDEDLA